MFLLFVRESSRNVWHAKKIPERAAEGTYPCVHRVSTSAHVRPALGFARGRLYRFAMGNVDSAM